MLLAYYGYRGSGDTNSQVSIADKSGLLLDELIYSSYALTSFDGNHAETGNFDTLVPLIGNKTLYFYIISTDVKTSNLRALAYRRIGSNS